MNEMKNHTDPEVLLPRRSILKVIAGAPLVATFGLLASPFLRYLRPTMKVGNFFQTADFPKAERSVRFHRSDFLEIWTCIPFVLPMRYVVFNPEGHEIFEAPGFILRTAADEIIAFSRICPNQHRQLLNFQMDTARLDCIAQSKTPVLYCPCNCCLSTFDLSDYGRVLGGPASRPLSRMDVTLDGEYYIITGLERPEIV